MPPKKAIIILKKLVGEAMALPGESAESTKAIAVEGHGARLRGMGKPRADASQRGYRSKTWKVNLLLLSDYG
jgi:hypothetical protein